jgi:undecaprenyl-diphosphatase
MPRGDSFDERLLHWIAEHRIDALTSVTTRVMDLGEVTWLLWTIAFLGLGFIVYKRAWREGLAVGVAFYAGAIASGLLKQHIARARPSAPDSLVVLYGNAFPSSHAAFTMAMVVALLVVVKWSSRRTLVLTASALGLAALFVGLAMVYLGAHWATDVLAGWAVGAVVGAGVGLLFKPRERSA